MLERLDTIDWANISTCYGCASEIPVAIRELWSEDRDARDIALGTIRHMLENQGYICEAAPLAVPFLLEVLANSAFQEKHLLVDFLTYLCSLPRYGETYLMLDQRVELQKRNEGRKRIPPGLRDVERERAEETHRALRAGLPIFCSLLSDSDPLIRELAAFLLAAFPADSSRLLEPVMRLLQVEKDEYARCSLLLCLGHLQEPLPEVSQLLLSTLDHAETPLLHYAAARALCLLLKEQAPEKAIDLFCQALIHPRFSWRPAYKPCYSPWSIEDTHTLALLSLDQLLTSPHRTRVIERLSEVYFLVEEDSDEACADLLLRVAFYEEGVPANSDGEGSDAPYSSIAFNNLTHLQQTILRLLADRESLWNKPNLDFDPFSGIEIEKPDPVSLKPLAYLELPSTRQSLRTFLHL